jgi:hypothetical protein
LPGSQLDDRYPGPEWFGFVCDEHVLELLRRGFEYERAFHTHGEDYAESVMCPHLADDDDLVGDSSESEPSAPGWYYLEFHDPDKPNTKGPDEYTRSFKGGAYVYGATGLEAIQRSWALGINPGGVVAFQGVYGEQEMDDNVPVANRDRLLGHHEIHTWCHHHHHA